MAKKQTKSRYPKEIIVFCEPVDHELIAFSTPEGAPDSVVNDVVAIYKFDRLAKVKRTVTVE